jgi:hypothetical protein
VVFPAAEETTYIGLIARVRGASENPLIIADPELNGSEVSGGCEVLANEDSVADRDGEAERLVVRVAEAERESSAELHDPEHLHAIAGTPHIRP